MATSAATLLARAGPLPTPSFLSGSQAASQTGGNAAKCGAADPSPSEMPWGEAGGPAFSLQHTLNNASLLLGKL